MVMALVIWVIKYEIYGMQTQIPAVDLKPDLNLKRPIAKISSSGPSTGHKPVFSLLSISCRTRQAFTAR